MKCKGCFRCIEDWRDARAKGLKLQHSKPLYSKKPRRGVKVKCTNIRMESEITTNSIACEAWVPRAVWSAKLRIGEIKSRARRIFEVCVRVPIGTLRKPARLIWGDDYDSSTDKIIRNAVPICPHCGEMPYSTKRCVFCGQRFIQDEVVAEYNKPPEKVTRNCPHCGGEKMMLYNKT